VIVAEAVGAATAHTLFCSLDPQIVIMDVTLPGVSGIEVTRHILTRRPDARVLMRPLKISGRNEGRGVDRPRDRGADAVGPRQHKQGNRGQALYR
jgi:CheY-like chemotaxis protein